MKSRLWLAACAVILVGSVSIAPPALAETIKAPLRLIEGQCGRIEPLEGMMRKNDGIARFAQVECSLASFAPPPGSKDEEDKQGKSSAFFALVDPSATSGLFLRGNWNGSDFNPADVSFDQQSWYPVSKGRCRIYVKDGVKVTIVCFAVYARGDKKDGVAVVFTQR